jgi:hypothetical protein
VPRPRLEPGEQSHGVGRHPHAVWAAALVYLALPVALLISELTRPQGTPVGVALIIVVLAIFLLVDLALLVRPVDVITGPRGIATVDVFGRRRQILWSDVVEIRFSTSPAGIMGIEVRARGGGRMKIWRTLIGRSFRTIADPEALGNTITAMTPTARVVYERGT